MLAASLALAEPTHAQTGKVELGANASLNGLRLLPADSLWHQDISQSPVDPLSARILARIGLDKPPRADFDVSGFSPEVKAILVAPKKYGMFLADNGSDDFISGAPHPKWNVDALRRLMRVKTRDLEVVEMKGIVVGRPQR